MHKYTQFSYQDIEATLDNLFLIHFSMVKFWKYFILKTPFRSCINVILIKCLHVSYFNYSSDCLNRKYSKYANQLCKCRFIKIIWMTCCFSIHLKCSKEFYSQLILNVLHTITMILCKIYYIITSLYNFIIIRVVIDCKFYFRGYNSMN